MTGMTPPVGRSRVEDVKKLVERLSYSAAAAVAPVSSRRPGGS